MSFHGNQNDVNNHFFISSRALLILRLSVGPSSYIILVIIKRSSLYFINRPTFLILLLPTLETVRTIIQID